MNKRITFSLGLILTLFPVSCTTEAERDKMDSISGGGTYTFGFEVSSFSADGYENESWWVSDPNQILSEIHQDWSRRKEKNGELKYPGYRVFLSGRFSPHTGNYGHLGMYDREFIVEDLAQYEYIKPNESNQSGDGNSE